MWLAQRGGCLWNLDPAWPGYAAAEAVDFMVRAGRWFSRTVPPSVPMRFWSKIQWVFFLPLKKFDLHNKHQSYTMGTSQQFLDVHSMSPKKPSDFHRDFPVQSQRSATVVKPPRICPQFHAEKFHGETSAASASGEALDAQGTEMACDGTEQGHCFLNFCCTMSYLFLDSTNIQEQRRVLTAQLL